MIIHNSVSAIRPSTHRLYRLDYIRHIPISAIDLKYLPVDLADDLEVEDNGFTINYRNAATIIYLSYISIVRISL